MKSPHYREARRSSALVITLAFIVLLTAVMLLFLSQALSYRNWGNSNFNDFKSNALGQSALEVVVGDLRQEIANGSTNYTFGSGTNTSYLYIPTNNLYAVPQRSGTNYFAFTDQTPNLVKISIRSDGIAYPGVGSRASAANSTNAASGGQYVSLARWNKHYLLPRLNTGSSTDTTPIARFKAPDWVFVTDRGPDVLSPTNPKQDAAGNSVTVIGRYAFAIYDEGGLIDANVAGTPTNTATYSTNFTSNPNNDVVWGSGLKGSEAFADLTVTNSVTSAPLLTQTQINQLVAWRNNATVSASGTFGGYSLSGTVAALAYHDYAVNNTNSFMATSGTLTANNTTDQAFTSRQALIAYATAAGWSMDSLQYLATFTRDTDQPCYVPPVGRPMVQSSSTSNSRFVVGSGPGFGTGNDAYGSDRASTSTNSPSDIDPPFLNVRVANSFTRADNTIANVGDPLIKERFPLSRLSLFPTNSATVSGTVAAQIYNYFGLTQSGTGVWFYNHGNSTGIYKLSQVAALSPGREPDFFELLKAAINVGSVAKGSCLTPNTGSIDWSHSPSGAYYEQTRDTQSQLQILQIGANIIDQAKADDFPTQIEFSGATGYTVRGIEDLPYFYRFRHWLMRTGSTGALGELLLQPELWNPHSTGSSDLVAKTSMPTNFRVRIALDPTAGSSPITGLIATYSDASTVDSTSAATFNTGITPAPLTFNAGAANGYWDFREPTLLAQIGKPSTSHLATTDPTYTDFPTYTPDSGRQMTGFQVLTFPWFNNTTAVCQKLWADPSGSNSSFDLFVEYQSGANWITYDEQHFNPYDNPTFGTKISSTSLGYNITNAQTLQTVSDVAWGGGARDDPRTCRWGLHENGYMNYIPAVTTGPSKDTSADPVVWGSYRPNGGISYGDHVGSYADWSFVGISSSYGTQAVYGYRGFQHGYWAENSVRQTYQTDGSSGTGLLRYNLDPDGVPRRAVGGYVTDTANGGSAGSTTASLPATGLPMYQDNYSSRPTILHRPFRSVAELGYVFRDTPWGNINFTFPESGDSPLLDVFCVNDTSATGGLVAGRVNLNTRQAPVLAALLSGTLLDKEDSTTPALSQKMASDLAARLVARTTTLTLTGTTQGPLMSRADLVGTWMDSTSPTTSKTDLMNAGEAYTINPDNFYTGFSYDIGTTLVPSVNSQSPPSIALIPRQRNSVMRALADAGTTRTWNLLIDLVAQSGRFSPTASSLNNFTVEGEKHYWLHVAIDRYTGKVIDSQLEVVKE